MLKNPFLIYVLSFGTVFFAYRLGWSEVYPDLSWDLLLFFGLTFLYSLLFAMVVSREVRQIGQYQTGQLPNITVLFLFAGFAADLVYSGIPLLMVLDGDLYNIGGVDREERLGHRAGTRSFSLPRLRADGVLGRAHVRQVVSISACTPDRDGRNGS